jgi:hypothetical protein
MMNPYHRGTPCTAFAGQERIAAGPLAEVALAAWAVVQRGQPVTVLVFEDATGRPIDIDYRGAEADVVARIPREPAPAAGSDDAGHVAADVAPETEATTTPAPPRGRGRPRLGVEAREVTLLPRHWAWLATQPGGASATLRRLVEEARRGSGARDRVGDAQEAAYRFMSAMAGDAPGFEEAARALFAGDRARFEHVTHGWSPDVRAHAMLMARDAFPAAS